MDDYDKFIGTPAKAPVPVGTNVPMPSTPQPTIPQSSQRDDYDSFINSPISNVAGIRNENYPPLKPSVWPDVTPMTIDKLFTGLQAGEKHVSVPLIKKAGAAMGLKPLTQPSGKPVEYISDVMNATVFNRPEEKPPYRPTGKEPQHLPTPGLKSLTTTLPSTEHDVYEKGIAPIAYPFAETVFPATGVSPEDALAQSAGKIGRGAANLGASIFLDPVFGKLNAGGKLINLSGKALGAAGKTTGITKKALEVTKPIRDYLRKGFTNLTENPIFNDWYRKQRWARGYGETQAGREATDLKNTLADMSRQYGIPEKELNRRFGEYVEKGVGGADMPVELRKVADDYAISMEAMRQFEAPIIGTENLKDVINYMPHALSDEGKAWYGQKTFGQANSRMWSSKNWSTLEREIKGKSIADINAEMLDKSGGTVGEFFKTDPASLYYLRKMRSVKATGGATFLDEAKKFGKQITKTDVPPADWMETSIPELKGYSFPKEIAEKLQQTVQITKEPEAIADALEAANSWAKRWTLGPFPSYHLRNMGGNVWLAHLGGLSNPFRYTTAGLIQSGVEMNLKTPMGVLSGKRILDEAAKRGVLGGGWYGGEMTKKVGGIAGKGMEVGRNIEDNARIALFIDGIMKGKTLDDSAANVSKFLFDYSKENLGAVEKKIDKATWFYSWIRNNLPLEVEQLVKQPEKFAMVAKAKRQYEEGTPKFNEAFENEMIRNGLAIRTGKDSKGNIIYKIGDSWWPGADLSKMMTLKNLKNTIIGMVNPAYKELVTQVLGKDIQTGQELTGKPMYYLGVWMPDWAAHALKIFRPISELNKLNPGGIFGTQEKTGVFGQSSPYPTMDPATRLSAFMLGRMYTYDEKEAREQYGYGLMRDIREWKSNANYYGAKFQNIKSSEGRKAFKGKHGPVDWLYKEKAKLKEKAKPMSESYLKSQEEAAQTEYER